MTRIYTFVAATLFVLLSCASSQGAVVTTTLQLGPAGGGENQLNLSLTSRPVGTPVANATIVGTTQANLTGVIKLDIDMTGDVVNSFYISGGSFDGAAWNLLGQISGSETTGTFETSSDDFQTVTGTSFAADQHSLVLQSGTVTAFGSSAFDFGEQSESVAGDPATAGLLSLSSMGGNQFGVQFELPLWAHTDAGDDGAGNILGLLVTGNIVATGTAVPEPSSFAALTVIGLAGVAVRRRRQRRALAPASADA